ncbi:hypothetical protein ACXET9_08350 [Brachybacterium sp. DNPG3]
MSTPSPPNSYGWESASAGQEPASPSFPDYSGTSSAPGTGSGAGSAAAGAAGSASTGVRTAPGGVATAERDLPGGPEGPGGPSGSGAPEPGGTARRRMPGWAIGAIVAGVIVLLSCLALAVATIGIAGWMAAGEGPTDDDPGYGDLGTYGIGVVTDSDGQEVADGTGFYDRPATVGEHAFSWDVWEGGTVTVRAAEVDTDATLPGAQGADVLQEGYSLVVVTLDVEYAGTGSLAPSEELWITGATVWRDYPEAGGGLVPDPLATSEVLTGGESTTVRVAFVVLDEDREGMMLSVGSMSGDTLFYDIDV